MPLTGGQRSSLQEQPAPAQRPVRFDFNSHLFNNFTVAFSNASRPEQSTVTEHATELFYEKLPSASLGVTNPPNPRREGTKLQFKSRQGALTDRAGWRGARSRFSACAEPPPEGSPIHPESPCSPARSQPKHSRETARRPFFAHTVTELRFLQEVSPAISEEELSQPHAQNISPEQLLRPSLRWP